MFNFTFENGYDTVKLVHIFGESLRMYVSKIVKWLSVNTCLWPN